MHQLGRTPCWKQQLEHDGPLRFHHQWLPIRVSTKCKKWCYVYTAAFNQFNCLPKKEKYVKTRQNCNLYLPSPNKQILSSGHGHSKLKAYNMM